MIYCNIFIWVRKEKINMAENNSYVLPSINEELRFFIIKNKINMMEHVISAIELATKNVTPIAEIFQFKGSQFVITISEQEFSQNVDNIHNFFMENEIYELCPRVIKLQKLLKRKNDEKPKKPKKKTNINRIKPT
jgi:hypothetical protein